VDVGLVVRYEQLSCKDPLISTPKAQTAAQSKEAGVNRSVGKE
jgi:hypothetical protein